MSELFSLFSPAEIVENAKSEAKLFSWKPERDEEDFEQCPRALLK
jgi:hypothetical protein